jgi:hypothetical protein
VVPPLFNPTQSGEASTWPKVEQICWEIVDWKPKPFAKVPRVPSMKHKGIPIKGVRLSKDGKLIRDARKLDATTRIKRRHSTKARPRRGKVMSRPSVMMQ